MGSYALKLINPFYQCWHPPPTTTLTQQLHIAKQIVELFVLRTSVTCKAFFFLPVFIPSVQIDKIVLADITLTNKGNNKDSELSGDSICVK